MKAKIIFIIILALLLIIFVLQNTTIVEIKFWFWELSIPRALLLFLCSAIGFIVGLIFQSTQKKDEQKEN